ncbi:sensor histidine kinase [Sphingobium nicotianae]|uniref:histidine kinase n=1 Tax=Sphingobium nicotianae TaxID=2782607 RepID=A0A9X1DD85_9SPHN|nr:HAMP domain-containing sensor histidine kinase [Sphingobium nicotianae]MBT2187883.1 HAMP domain-containing histidine kinase [Sphingobium nicotianae]
MKGSDSIVGRLTLSLTLVALIGALLLLLFIGIEYRMSFAELSDASALPAIIHELTEHVVIPMLLLATPMTLTGLWAIRRALKPLEEAARKIDAAQGQSRGVRVEVESLPLEAKPFARSVNALLDRVDVAAAMHEAFAADIAHELRTPLTLLSLELDQLDGAKSEQLRLDVGAMRRLIDQLMLLAQVDAERAAHTSPTPVDLVELAGDVVAQMAPAALADGRQIELNGENSGVVPGRREAIAAALRNLVENALRVTPAGDTVVVLADRPGELAVRDGGEGLSPERLDILVQRLRRADHASSNGAGLGLAIVARIMAAHGGRLVTNPDRRELRLIFPLC